MERDDYLKAGRIAAEVREAARSRDWTGRTVYEVCEEIEGQIRARGAACAFPVNTSINEVAAHYTAEPADPLEVGEADMLKIDLGAQVNGHIADTAVTVCGDPQYEPMVRAAEDALGAAMSAAEEGARSGEIGRLIEESVKGAGFLPIANLSGHSLDRYTIHAGRSIPNVRSFGGFSLSAGSAYACEPFVTTGEGGGFVRNGQVRNIFAIKSRKKTKDAGADAMLDHIWESFNMLPFALRWLTDRYEAAEARRLLDHLVRKKAVQAYPVLVEVNGQRVAQAEHTFIPGPGGPTVTTAAP